MKKFKDLTRDDYLKAARKAGEREARQVSVGWWKARPHDRKAIYTFSTHDWHTVHPHSDGVYAFTTTLASQCELESKNILKKINWKDKALREAFYIAFVAETQKRLGGKPPIPTRLIKVAQKAGVAAGKNTDLGQINRRQNIPKQLDDLADEAWEHDGIPALENAASEKEWDSIQDAAVRDAYIKTFKATLNKRLRLTGAKFTETEKYG